MIQRIQSVFLLLASACSFLLFQFPFATNETVQSSAILNDGVYNLHDNIAMLVLFALGGVLALGALVSFKNRKNQSLIARLAFVANLIGMILVVVLFFNDPAFQSESAPDDGIGAYLPTGAMVLIGLALYFINKDEKLVKSMDRLR